VLLVEDAQHADPALLDFLDHLKSALCHLKHTPRRRVRQGSEALPMGRDGTFGNWRGRSVQSGSGIAGRFRGSVPDETAGSERSARRPCLRDASESC
jgi:hypothetical protein